MLGNVNSTLLLYCQTFDLYKLYLYKQLFNDFTYFSKINKQITAQISN